MGSMWLTVCCALFFSVQALPVQLTEEPYYDICFESKLLTLTVTEKVLKPGMILGKVDHSDCTDIMTIGSISNDFTFMAKQDGILRVTSEVVLHEGHRDFSIYSLGSEAQSIITLARVVYDGHNHNMTTDVDATKEPDAGYPQVPILDFPKSNGGLKRRKRHWAMPPISVSENQRGPYPMHLVQIRSNVDKSKTVHYSITGPGADQPPNNLFTIDRNTGNLYVTQKLDREEQAEYKLVVHTVAEGSSGNAEDPMEIIIRVIDQNDNKPVFNQTTYEAEVPEDSPKGFEVIQVEATDADEPDNDNSAIRYRIMREEPQGPSPSVFAIDPVTGVITVNAEALDRGYTLLVEAADFAGEGLAAQAKVLINVSTNDDNPPVISQPADAVNPEAPVLLFPQSSGGLKRRKRDWVIPPIGVSENQRGPYPLKINQIRSREEHNKKIYYSITGPGADQPPINLFTMDRDTGNLYVTQQLDREKQAEYKIWAHAVAEGSIGNAEDPMEIIIKVIDQNDNKPVFNQSTYEAEVPEASPKGFEVIQVEATDADEPHNGNSAIRYRIMREEPQGPSPSVFAIDPVTGVITVNAEALDRGDAVNPEAPVLLSPQSSGGLKRRKRDWVIPPLSVPENHRGPYPFKINQIRSSEDSIKKIYYSITGPGADQPPINLFTMDRGTGNLYVTQELDREKQAQYKIWAHAVAEGSSGNAEEPMEIIIKVIDQNDNVPDFDHTLYVAEVSENSPNGFDVIQVLATDADEPNNDNSDIRYRIMEQVPAEPSPNMFTINSVTGAIRVNVAALDREMYPEYTLKVSATDLMGVGHTGISEVIIKVTDSNDHAPVFTEASYTATVDENKVDAEVVRMLVTDGDEPRSSAWNAKFTIVDGDPGNLFTVKTGSNKQEGIITTAKGLEFEKTSKHTLLVAVENEIPFATALATSTATVVVNVRDVNDPLILQSNLKTYNIVIDQADWLNAAEDTGLNTLKCSMQKDSALVRHRIQPVVIDADDVLVIATGTLVIQAPFKVQVKISQQR